MWYVRYKKGDILHFNPNHDPSNGQFARSKGAKFQINYSTGAIDTKIEHDDQKQVHRLMKTIKYDDTEHGLKSPEETLRSRSGNCHDQSLLELKLLREKGYKPKAAFVMEYDPKTYQGGVTHSFVYYKDGNKTKWFEHAWGDKSGIHEFKNFKEIQKEIEKIHKVKNKFGDNKKFTDLAWGNFDDKNLKPGDTLQDIVNKAFEFN